MSSALAARRCDVHRCCSVLQHSAPPPPPLQRVCVPDRNTSFIQVNKNPAIARGSRPQLPAHVNASFFYLLVAIIRKLTATPPNACNENFEGRDRYFGRTGVRRGSAMVPLDRARVSSYRLSIVTMPLTEAVWPQVAMQLFGGAVSTPVWGEWGSYGVRIATTGSGKHICFFR